jgi:uncharacterized protein (TIGR02266 family)
MENIDREPRKAVDLDVQVRNFSLTTAVDRLTRNLSRGGAFIEMETPFPEGTLVKVVMTTPEDKTISGAARVAWTRTVDIDAQEPAGMGIQFLKISDDGLSLIDDILTKAEAVEGGKHDAATQKTSESDDRLDPEEKVIITLQETLDRELVEAVTRATKESASRRHHVPPLIWLLGLASLVGLILVFTGHLN